MAEYTLPQATKNMDQAIRCIEMHTTGEPTRIVYAGYPALSGTLLEQRALASEKYDHLRRRLILEPRGHRDMYGAVLRQSTELVDAGLADIGVIFMTNDGYSNMCGHATIALGRFLIDTFEVTIFPKRKALQVTPAGTLIRLHAPSGIVEVTVQTLQDGRSDPSKPVSFLSVPSFATGWDIRITVPPERRWHVGREVETVSVNFAYGGAFFCMVDARRLYSSGQKATLAGDDLKALEEAAFAIRDLVNEDKELRKFVTLPNSDNQGLGMLYAIVVVFDGLGKPEPGTASVETGLCFFDNHQIDRSPTGSAVCARMALAHARGDIALGEARTYHSLVSNSHEGQGAFIARIVEGKTDGLRVQLGGRTYYTGSHVFVHEPSDYICEGFMLDTLRGWQGD